MLSLMLIMSRVCRNKCYSVWALTCLVFVCPGSVMAPVRFSDRSLTKMLFKSPKKRMHVFFMCSTKIIFIYTTILTNEHVKNIKSPSYMDYPEINPNTTDLVPQFITIYLHFECWRYS